MTSISNQPKNAIMEKLRITGILIKDRIKEAGRTQKVLSEYGHIIRSRMGYHEVSEEICSRVGTIVLTLGGKIEEQDKMMQELQNIGGIEVKEMVFEL